MISLVDSLNGLLGLAFVRVSVGCEVQAREDAVSNELILQYREERHCICSRQTTILYTCETFGSHKYKAQSKLMP